MAQITKDLGGITAYADAVAAGYTGTKAQFETLMASYATVAQNAAASATAAANSKSDAEAYAKGTRNGTPVSSGDAAYENNSKYFAEQAGDYAESLDPDTIARIDGYYDTLGAGTAEQLTSNIYEEDSEPYNFRTSGGSIDIGDRETDMLVGGTVAWNQLLPTLDTFITEGGVTKTYSDGVATITSTTARNGIYAPLNYQTGHKYLITCDIKTATAYSIILGATSAAYLNVTLTADNQWHTISGIINSPTSGNKNAYMYMTTTFENVQVKNYMLIDLTQMFGSTIADYIYNLEQATAGAGVAWFKKLFPKPYYAYNAGELMSVNTSAHNTVGFNAWDEEWELGQYSASTGNKTSSNTAIRCKNKIPILPNTQYYFQFSSGAMSCICFYDANEEFISGSAIGISSPKVLVSPSNAYYLAFHMNDVYGATYKNDICINISWDGERDGEYEPYVKHEYALDSDLELRGIPKLDASNNLYYDGDTYESDGTVTRKYGIVDLGTLTWAKGTHAFYTASLASLIRKASSNGDVVYVISTKPMIPKSVASVSGDEGTYEYYVGTTGNLYWFYPLENYVDGNAFKTAMSGVYLVYELATPTTETADPFTNPQIVDDFGTEEYVDGLYSVGTRDVAIPVGHQTQYMANLKAKLEMSPSSPEGAGDYIVRQTNGENEYVTLASNATIQNIIARLEALEGGGE